MGLARTLILATISACLAAAPAALAAPPALVGNGGFEGIDLTPWSASSYGARVVDQTEWTPAGGKKSAELANYGWLYQDIATTAFQRYDVSFALAGNPGCAPGGRTLEVSWNPFTGAAGGAAAYGANQSWFTFDTTGHTLRPAWVGRPSTCCLTPERPRRV